jgi:hypothetical protein
MSPLGSPDHHGNPVELTCELINSRMTVWFPLFSRWIFKYLQLSHWFSVFVITDRPAPSDSA